MVAVMEALKSAECLDPTYGTIDKCMSTLKAVIADADYKLRTEETP
jgi:hypothetical protein